jgi:hypothetical protein
MPCSDVKEFATGRYKPLLTSQLAEISRLVLLGVEVVRVFPARNIVNSASNFQPVPYIYVNSLGFGVNLYCGSGCS